MKFIAKCISVVSGIVTSLIAFTGCNNSKSEDISSVYGPPSYFGIKQEDEKPVNQPEDAGKAESDNNDVHYK